MVPSSSAVSSRVWIADLQTHAHSRLSGSNEKAREDALADGTDKGVGDTAGLLLAVALPELRAFAKLPRQQHVELIPKLDWPVQSRRSC